MHRALRQHVCHLPHYAQPAGWIAGYLAVIVGSVFFGALYCSMLLREQTLVTTYAMPLRVLIWITFGLSLVVALLLGLVFRGLVKGTRFMVVVGPRLLSGQGWRTLFGAAG